MGVDLSNLTSIALALWVGGLSLFSLVVTPVSFRRLPKEEAGRFVGLLFPAVDRWAVVWGTIATLSLLVTFLNRHFAPRSLALEIPVGIMLLLSLHSAYILHPQIQELRRKMALPEFQGTAHLEKLRFAFSHLHRRSVQLHTVMLVLGWFSLGLLPRFL